MSETREAGRELDVEVATGVMGYEWRRRQRQEGSPLKWLVSPEDRATFTWGNDPLQGDETQAVDFDRCVPRFSTDIASAWTVVDRVDNRNSVAKSIGVRTFSINRYGDGSYSAGFFGEYAKAATAPLAICLAALKAVSASGSGSE